MKSVPDGVSFRFGKTLFAVINFVIGGDANIFPRIGFVAVVGGTNIDSTGGFAEAAEGQWGEVVLARAAEPRAAHRRVRHARKLFR